MGLPTEAGQLNLAGLTAERMLTHMRQDKKVADGQLTFILARGIGQSFITKEVDEGEVREMLQDALQPATTG
jgi:3-dehydroquinate synthetase